CACCSPQRRTIDAPASLRASKGSAVSTTGKDSPARSFTTLQARRHHRPRGSFAIDPRVTSAAFARTQEGTRLAARDAEAPEWQITTRGNTRETRKLTRSATPEPSARRATRQPVVAEEGAAAAREARRHPKRRAPHRRAAVKSKEPQAAPAVHRPRRKAEDRNPLAHAAESGKPPGAVPPAPGRARIEPAHRAPGRRRGPAAVPGVAG